MWAWRWMCQSLLYLSPPRLQQHKLVRKQHYFNLCLAGRCQKKVFLVLFSHKLSDIGRCCHPPPKELHLLSMLEVHRLCLHTDCFLATMRLGQCLFRYQCSRRLVNSRHVVVIFVTAIFFFFSIFNGCHHVHLLNSAMEVIDRTSWFCYFVSSK